MDYIIKGGNENSKITVSEHSKDGIIFLNVNMELEKEDIPKTFQVHWRFPDIDVYSYWSPSSAGNLRSLDPNWRKRKTESRLASNMPIHQLISLAGQNRCLIAVSDAFTPMTIGTGVCESDSNMDCYVDFFTNKTAARKSYSATIRIDMRDLPYYDCIYDTVDWWENECGYTPAFVPDAAKQPLDSLWYSFHQKLETEEIIKECKLSKQMGMETVIVDDGWQTDDNSRGYAYCGDWELCKNKIPDMRYLVDEIHKIGMKFMIWYSVPFVGKYSKKYKEFEGYYLDLPVEKPFGTLDPRYKVVREYLIGIYEKAVKEWDLDGLKLDFIDYFSLYGKSLEADNRRDYTSLEDGIDALMVGITKRLTAIKPDILIEFRQTYVGPAIRKYGNMLRVADCPNDAMKNRMGIIDLRFTSKNTAVHSDMLMWNYDEPVETAALQIIPTLYGVPQISMRIDRLSDEHKKMLQFYLDFWKEHRDCLIEGELTAKNPESCYSIACASLGNIEIYTAYTDNVIIGNADKTIAINSSANNYFVLKNCKGRNYKVVSCTGQLLRSGTIDSNLAEVIVERAAIVFAEK